MSKVLSHRPRVVLNLHEDDEIESCYAYCSEPLQEIAEKCVAAMRTVLPGNTTSIHHDHAENGVIIGGNIPCKGTLEKELEKYGILYVCMETPEMEKITFRIKALTKGVMTFIKEWQKVGRR